MMEQDKLKSIIESVLFMHGEPVKLARLQKITGALKPEVENTLMILSTEYATQGKGLRIVTKDDCVQLVTAPENAAYIQQLIEGELQETLSNSALEVLSVVAYRGPITRSEIEAIRGVNCSYTLRSLLMRGLIERNDNPKDARGYVYAISFEFLKKLGLENIKTLPDYAELSQDARLDSLLTSPQAQGLDELAPVTDEQPPAIDSQTPTTAEQLPIVDGKTHLSAEQPPVNDDHLQTSLNQ